MKTIQSLILAGSILLIVVSAKAQKVMGDPSYSIHNYKHPNKAAYMKKVQDEKPVVYMEEVVEPQSDNYSSSMSSSNYKGMNAGNSKIRKYRVGTAPAVSPVGPAGNGNYKQQFAPRTRKTEDNQ